ncbi:Ser/Thr protein kinase RdoA (MazF antagonist) [Palleronia aestuarii]|uniref:Hydroxylysine kinase n=1 Tax=Palleronia aestuarii TaxID=568105 RepID=A0A2W7NC35_9RHOB|nr:phosphotransferase [Palleronia aestuarii]PZX17173.1 Ser/Thr protein kinase RdoA (MazF antagonist) [Palleronia aestuarii]
MRPEPLAAPGLDPSLADIAPQITPEVAAEIARVHYGVVGAATSLPGEKDSNFAITSECGTRLFLKIVSPGEPPEISDFHTEALVHLEARAAELPILRLRRTLTEAPSLRLDFGAGDRRTVRATSFAHGRAQTDCHRNAAQSRAIGAVAARLQTALADFRHPADGHRTTWDLARAGELRDLPVRFPEAAQSRRVARALAAFDERVTADLPRQVVHNDMNTDNVLMDPRDPARVSGIIDFGDMVRTARVFDAAIGAAHQMGRSEDPLDPACAFLSGFSAERPLDEAEITLLPAAIEARMAMRVLIPQARADRLPERRAYILRNSSDVWRQFDRLDAMPRDRIAGRIAEACAR